MKTKINHVYEFSAFKLAMAAIERIKLKQRGDVKENEAMRLKLIREIEEFGWPDNDRFKKSLLNELDADEHQHKSTLAHNDIAQLSNLFAIKKRLVQMSTKAAEIELSEPRQGLHARYEINKIQNMIFDTTPGHLRMCEEGQRLDDVKRELDRIGYLLNFFSFSDHKAKRINQNSNVLANAAKIGLLLADVEVRLVKRVHRFDEHERESVKRAFDELKKLCSVELTPEEKMEIVNAMGVKKGSWYQCRNGHMYTIGECGGAMETAKCPECKGNDSGLKVL